jgi:3-hydroxyisobutyrate dehydrogenase-like beta-hydroxyacid dehydrogenase
MAGTLSFMVGGSGDLLHEISPIVSMMGSPPFFCGNLGAGLATKQINNYLSAITTIGTCEAMNMGVKNGLDPKILAGVINVSSGRNYNCELMNPVKGVVEGNSGIFSLHFLEFPHN